MKLNMKLRKVSTKVRKVSYKSHTKKWTKHRQTFIYKHEKYILVLKMKLWKSYVPSFVILELIFYFDSRQNFKSFVVQISQNESNSAYHHSKHYVHHAHIGTPKVIIHSCTFLPFENQKALIQYALAYWQRKCCHGEVSIEKE